MLPGHPRCSGLGRVIDPGVNPQPERIVAEVSVAHVEEDRLTQRTQPRVRAVLRENVLNR